MNISSPLGSAANYHDSSLLEQIDLEAKSSKTTGPRIGSLLLKYYHLCVTGEDPEKAVSYNDMESIYHDSQLLLLARRSFKIGNNPFLPTESAMIIVRDHPRFWNHIQIIGHELRMLGDIPATTLIFRDIIERIITSKKHKSRFVGLDLGTGTGVLLLALSILACKNGCDNVKLYGLSDCELGVKHVRTLMQKIHCPAEIIEGDTTQKSTYDGIDMQHISMVCNENIPYYEEGIHAEPFFHNIYTLRESRQNLIDSETHFFPERVTVTRNGSLVHDCSSRNNFLVDQVDRDKKAGLSYRYREIDISGKLLPLKDFHIRAADILGFPPCHPATLRW